MKHWLAPADIIAVCNGELPGSIRNFNKLAERQGWRRDPAKARKAQGRGGGWLYHISVLPGEVQARIKLANGEPTARERMDRDQLWMRFEALSRHQKTVCEARLKVLLEVEAQVQAGNGQTAAMRAVAKSAGVSVATLCNWNKQVEAHERSDWLAALAPAHKGRRERAECHPEAWSMLVSDYLRAEKPSLSTCMRRMHKAAKREKWSPIPSERALRRRLDAEVPAEVQTLARSGKDAVKAKYPAQRRTTTHMHAMQAVNMDGHRCDVFVKMPDGRVIRPHLIALQDIYSRKFIAWRLSDSENKEVVRLVIGDMVERYGIPDSIYLDNGRAFASKQISGGSKTRFRFKIREEDPKGLLTSLGIAINWTKPYSGQSKPIERAFRDLTDTIARHPACAGAYTGNRPDAKPENHGSKAVPLEEFRALCVQEIANHNAQPNRRTETAKGRSFDETFTASLAEPSTIVRWPTKAQKALWLLAADLVSAQKGSGEVSIYGNRYWAQALNGFAGQKVTVRFDPDRLADGVQIYDRRDQFICHAPLIGDKKFDQVDEARKHERRRNAYLKSVKEQQRFLAETSAEELARLVADETITEPKPERPVITRIGNNLAVEREPVWNEEAEAKFSKALRLVGGSEFDE